MSLRKGIGFCQQSASSSIKDELYLYNFNKINLRKIDLDIIILPRGLFYDLYCDM